jgi:hypothetical protein
MTRRTVFSALFGATLALSAFALGGCNNDKPAEGGGASTVNTTSPGKADGQGGKLVIAWAEWEPAKQMQNSPRTSPKKPH